MLERAAGLSWTTSRVVADGIGIGIGIGIEVRREPRENGVAGDAGDGRA
jgi:hypothetical protein